MCDIKNFDKLIHSQGYASADDIFCRFTSKLNSLLRPTDWLCRFSGEELMLFVEGTRNQLPSILNRLIRQSAVTIKIRSEDLNLTLNMGCLVMHSHCVPLSIDEILAKVDATLMEAKTTNAGSFLLTELEAKQRNNVVDLVSMRGNRDSLR